MTTFRKINISCPCCEHQFQTEALTSTNTFGPRFTDLHVQAVGFQPLLIIINTCPQCGFSGYLKDFEEPLSADIKAHIRQELTPRVESVDAPRSYEFAARIKTWQEAPALQIGDLYLRAAWCCMDAGDTEREAEYRRLTIQYFLQALEQGQVRADDEPTVTYLVGELYRRIGQTGEARLWFNKVIARAAEDPEWQEMEWLATQQRDDPQDRLD